MIYILFFRRGIPQKSPSVIPVLIEMEPHHSSETTIESHQVEPVSHDHIDTHADALHSADIHSVDVVDATVHASADNVEMDWDPGHTNHNPDHNSDLAAADKGSLGGDKAELVIHGQKTSDLEVKVEDGAKVEKAITPDHQGHSHHNHHEHHNHHNDQHSASDAKSSEATTAEADVKADPKSVSGETTDSEDGADHTIAKEEVHTQDQHKIVDHKSDESIVPAHQTENKVGQQADQTNHTDTKSVKTVTTPEAKVEKAADVVVQGSNGADGTNGEGVIYYYPDVLPQEHQIINPVPVTPETVVAGDSHAIDHQDVANPEPVTHDVKHEDDLTHNTESAIEPPALPEKHIDFTSGTFTVGAKGEVGVNYVFDGGKYRGDLAIFSLKDLEKYDINTAQGWHDFVLEVTNRALSNSEDGHVIIADATEGARFSGILSKEPQDWNTGTYKGVETFNMRPGDTFGVMLVPNGTVQQLHDRPDTGGDVRPLFSMVTANPNEAFHLGQVADVNGKGNTFAMEDIRFDQGSDRDYNDVVFQFNGATSNNIVKMDEMVDPALDWRTSELGVKLMEFIKPPANQPLIGIIDTGISGNNPNLDYFNIHFGSHSDLESGDGNPILQPGEGSQHGTFVTAVIQGSQPHAADGVSVVAGGTDGTSAADAQFTTDKIVDPENRLITIDDGTSKGAVNPVASSINEINAINAKAPLYEIRAVGSGQWAQGLKDFVDAAKESGQPNAIANLSIDLTQINPDGKVVTRYEFTPFEREALEYARQNHVLVVAAAGNDGKVMSVLGQASQEYDNIITVGAGDANGRYAYSSFGRGLDLLADGGTTEHPVTAATGSGLGTMAGTSIATAKVTGAASVVWAENPDLSYRQVIDILEKTAKDLATLGWDKNTGFGFLDVAAALQLAKTTIPTSHATPALKIPKTWVGAGKVTPIERAVSFDYNGNSYDWVPYMLQYGDTLSQIAFDTLGDAFAYQLIADHNSISNPNQIIAGHTIEIPQLVTVSSPPPGNGNNNPFPSGGIQVGEDHSHGINQTYQNTFDRNGGYSALGDPTDYVDRWGNGFSQPFDNASQGAGWIMKSNANNDSYWVGGDIFQYFMSHGDVNFYGYPVSDAYPDGNGGEQQDFEFGSIVIAATGGGGGGGVIIPPPPELIINGHIIRGDFVTTFNNAGGVSGILGNPISDAYSINGGMRQDFEGGSIFQSGSGTLPVFGGVGDYYFNNESGADGRLGLPTSSEVGVGNGVIIQHFQYGDIVYGNGPTHAVINGQKSIIINGYTIDGAIYDSWVDNQDLGNPTENYNPDTLEQHFEYGYIDGNGGVISTDNGNPVTPPPDNNPRQTILTGNAFIDSISSSAIKSQSETGVPASVTIAQAILESGWGKSGLAANYYNYFGIKGDGPAGHIDLPTWEVINGQNVTVIASFRRYNNAQESFTDHGKFFLENSRYAEALKYKSDGRRFAQEIAKAGYATDPSYANTLIQLINQFNLTQFDTDGNGNSVTLPPTNNATLEALAGKSLLSIDEIQSYRQLVAQLPDSQRTDWYRKLQYKTPYFNQRNNKSPGIADAMCNLTTLASCLTYLGVENPNSSMQFEDYVENYNNEKGYGSRETWQPYVKISRDFGANPLDNDKAASKTGWGYTQSNIQLIKDALDRGGAVMGSLAVNKLSHIVRIQGYDNNGFIVDDPFGLATDGGTIIGGYNTYKTRNSTTAEEGSTVYGDNNHWSWDYIKQYGEQWFLIIEEGDVLKR